MQAAIGTVVKFGNSVGIRLRRETLDELAWRTGDTIAVRVAGEKLYLERVPLEKLAIPRIVEPAVRK